MKMAPVNKLFHIIQKRFISVEKSELSTFSLKQQEATEYWQILSLV